MCLLFNRKGAVPKRWRMWKKGKHWVYGCLLFLGMGVVSPLLTFAETQPTVDSTSVNQLARVGESEEIPDHPPSSVSLEESTEPVVPSESSDARTVPTIASAEEEERPVIEQLTINPEDYGLPKETQIIQNEKIIEVTLPEGAKKADLKQELSQLETFIQSKGFTLEVTETTMGTKATGSVYINNVRYQWDDATGEAAVAGATSLFSGALIIPDTIDDGQGNSYPVTEISRQAFKDNLKITSVTIGNNVKKIDDEAFLTVNPYTVFTDVSFGNSVEEIGEGAFNGRGIANLVLPDSLTVLGEAAFANNSILQTIKISKNLAEIPDRAFLRWGGPSLSVDIPSNIKKIGTESFVGAGLRLGRQRIEITFHEGLVSVGRIAFGGNAAVTSKLELPNSLEHIEDEGFRDIDITRGAS